LADLLKQDYRRLLNSKANKTTFGKGIPNVREGRNGDFTVRVVEGKGIKLFLKYSDRWYSIPIYSEYISRDDLDRIISKRPPKYVGEIGFDSTNKEFKLKQSQNDSIKYAGATTKIERDVNDGNPAFQIGSSDTECFKISCDYKSGEKGLVTTSFNTLTAGEDANAGKMFFSVGGTRKLELNDSNVTIMGLGSATADTEALIIENDSGNHASMTNTRTSIAFYQKYQDTSSLLVDSAKITVGTEGNWSGTASTQDAYMSFSVALNGTMSEYMKINSDGTVGVGTNKYLTLSDNEIDVSSGDLTLDVAGDIELNADSGAVVIKNDTANAFLLDNVASRFRIYDHLNTNDHFTIQVNDEGATTLTTVDADTAAAHLSLVADGDIVLDADGDIDLNADGGIVTIKDDASNVAIFDSSNFRFRLYNSNSSLQLECTTNRGAATIQTIDASTANEGHLTISPAGALMLQPIIGGMYVKEKNSAGTDVASYGQLWVKNETPNELYFTTDAGDDIQITDGTSMAGGGGGTQKWTFTVGGFKSNNNSSSIYYFTSYPGYYFWTNSDSSPTTLSYTDISSYEWGAPASGTLTNIHVTLRAFDTGLTDPVRFYVYKGAPGNGAGSTSLTLIGTTGAITPISGKQMMLSTDISSSNTFSANDKLWVMYKKDSTSGNQDLYFSLTVSGEYD